ncbi:MAG: hypothetical protein KKE76_13805 [Gammaproteobacteria bacterium]|nr:hypothetical protein [Gammaproteobacteria bacterium]
MCSYRLALWFLAALLISSLATAADPLSHQSEQLDVQLAPRTPQQMAAFYEARGFGRDMIDSLNEHCFITVAIHNKSADVIWLDLNQWHFKNAAGEVLRQDRVYWRERWNRMQIPLAHQSTFRWTLLPEQLDFRPGEYEGGNITLPRLGKPMTITAQFYPDEQRNGTPITVKFDNVQCAENP